VLPGGKNAFGMNRGFRRGIIAVAGRSLSAFFICHELAHVIADLGPNCGHSHLWVFVYLDLLALFDLDGLLAAELIARNVPHPAVPLSDCMRNLEHVSCIRLSPKLFTPGAKRTHRCLLGPWGVAAREDVGRACYLCGRVALEGARGVQGHEEDTPRLRGRAVGQAEDQDWPWPADRSSLHWHEPTREILVSWEEQSVEAAVGLDYGEASTWEGAVRPIALSAGDCRGRLETSVNLAHEVTEVPLQGDPSWIEVEKDCFRSSSGHHRWRSVKVLKDVPS
jgi:hypothetical protein